MNSNTIYEMSPEARRVVKEFRTTNPDKFDQAMKDTQAELIRVHWSEMDETTQRRAQNTLDWLESCKKVKESNL